jgi:5-methylcytosine-specific restriction enzyme B
LNADGFKTWLEGRGVTASAMATRLSSLRTINRNLTALGVGFPDLDAAYDGDGLASTRAALERIKLDARQGGNAFRLLMPDSEQPQNRLANFVTYVGQYGQFRAGEEPKGRKIADQIRAYVIETYIDPARQRGDPTISVKVGDINAGLGLSQGWANICKAISGPLMQAEANVAPPIQEGADASPATIFVFDLGAPAFTMEAVEGELARRFGPAAKVAQKMSAYALEDGRQIALERDRLPAQLWIEAGQPLPVGLDRKLYEPTQGRHSGLPGRLAHAGSDVRAVASVKVRSWRELTRLLDWYSGPATLDLARLEHFKQVFLERFGDFKPAAFAGASGRYFDEERKYKEILIERVQGALKSLADADEPTLGARLLDLLVGRGGVPGGLLNWRTNSQVQALRSQHPGVLEIAAGRLARAHDMADGVAGFIEATWPMMSEGQKSKPYSDTRDIPTMLAGLVRPDAAYGINSNPLKRTYRELCGQDPFGWNALKRDEYERVLTLAREIKRIMADDWAWAPRDLWDVQGFVWAINDADTAKSSEEVETSAPMNASPKPTNLILYGPPGTGKTYATAAEAVRLCSPAIDLSDRDKVMAEYARLVEARQVEFVTFHQSYSYEDFVEGLRPVTGGEGQAGFQLKPEMGTFRRIVQRAETSKGVVAGEPVPFDPSRVFKMSLGEAANPEDAYLFEEAIADNCILLGFGDIDWSDERFASTDAIIDAWREREPERDAPTLMSARVQCPNMFRNWMRKGDLLIISRGNGRFRAVGVVIGPYQYVPREDGGYPHRRAVRWLWSDAEGVPVEEIYDKRFMMKTLYMLSPELMNTTALNRYVTSQQPGPAAPDQFVLIIDEINRANISKVFGELITLLEADKRTRPDGSGLRVRLPYSGQVFGVPANLHIVGTMNTADRSIALLDTALRRRFEFRELMPDPKLLGPASEQTGTDLVTLLAQINDRIEYLFDREHQIGHAYFIGCKTRDDVDEVMRHKVIPLLAEYFYEDWAKVAAVLGDVQGDGRFITRHELKAPAGLDQEEAGEPRYRWSVRDVFADDRYLPRR